MALDTTAIFGRGALKDTYNMLADGLALVGRRLALGAGETEAAWAEREGYQRYISEPSRMPAIHDPQARHGARPSPTVSSGTRPISRWTPTSR